MRIDTRYIIQSVRYIELSVNLRGYAIYDTALVTPSWVLRYCKELLK